jgi:hypothetical protein
MDNAVFGNDTSIGNVLHDIADRIHRRSLLILISDLMDNPSDILAGIKHMRHNNHEVLVFQVLDPAEINFDFSGDILFEDLESGQKIKTQPQYIRSEYQDRVEQYLSNLKTQFSNNRIDYQLLQTDSPFHVALNEFLLKRQRLF